MTIKYIALNTNNESWLKNDGSSEKEIGLYNPVGDTNLILNGGGPGATDWINPTSGLASGWSANLIFVTCSIITGINGFTTNAQRSVRKIGVGGIVSLQYYLGLTGKVGAKYNVSLKYRSGTSFGISTKHDANSSNSYAYTSANTGNAITYNNIELTHHFDDLYSFAVSGVNDGLTGPSVWIEVDEIYVYEVI